MEKLTADQKQVILTRVKELDPKGEIVSLSPDASFTKGTISYNKTSGITFGENITRLTDEEYVRAYLVVRLAVQLHYPLDSIEVEHTYTIGRPSATKAQIDVRVLDRREKKIKTFMLIEAKRPDDFDSYVKLIEDQLFAPGRDEHSRNIRYVVWYTIEFRDNQIYDKCIVIDFRKFTEYKEWVEEGEPGHNLELPVEYGTVRKTRYVKGSKTDLRTDLTRKELTQLQKNFHNVLWGGAKMGDTDVFNNLLKMFLAKIYDENKTKKGQPYSFQSEVKDGVPETAGELTAKVNRIYKDALKHYFGYAEDKLATAIINENRFPPNKVAHVMEKLESISITQNKYEDDVLGAFFEAIVRTGFKQEKGQFFTHANIVRFMLYALELDEYPVELINGVSPTLPYIMDASCGSGTFLIEAMKVITDSVLVRNRERIEASDLVEYFLQTNFFPTAANKNAHNRWAKDFVYGIEDGEDLAMATKVNMILHGDGNANIMKADGLLKFEKYARDRCRIAELDANAPYKYPVNEKFDVIISNPPFSLQEESRTLSEYGTRFAYADRKNSENLFIERWYQFLKPGGRLGVVLPDSVFDTNENLYIRMFLYRFFWIKAVVSLPQVTFQPYTPTKTSLLFAVKKSLKEVETWDEAWRKASNEYGKLRKVNVVRFVLNNDRLRNSLIDLANKTEVEWYPSANLLSMDSLPAAIRQQMIEASQESNSLKKRVAERLKEFDEFLAIRTLEEFDDEQQEEAAAILARLLRDKLPRNADTLALAQLIETAYDDVVEASTLNYTEDPHGQNYCNAWWCFAEVTARPQLDYEIFFAEAEHVGYKRTTRHPDGIPQSNDLFQADADGNVIIDTESPKTILDYLRSKRFFFCSQSNIDEVAKLRTFHRYLRDVSKSFGLRFTPKFLHPRFDFFNRELLSLPLTSFGSLCRKSVRRGVQPEYDETGEVTVIKTMQLKHGFLDLSDALKVTYDFLAKNKRAVINTGDIVISSTGEGRGKIDLYELDDISLADSHISIASLRPERNPKFVSYYLRSRYGKWQIEQTEMAVKATPELYSHQIEGLRIIDWNKKKIDKITLKIAKIESAWNIARARLRQPQDIINEILCREFDYPVREHQERERERNYNRKLSQMSAGFTLRNSAKFHHPDFELTDRFFAVTPYERVKNYVSIPIRLGATAVKGDFVEDGDAYYVHPGATKRQEVIDVEDCHQVTQKFYDKYKRRFSLQPGDVVLNRAGEGTIGKSGLFYSDEQTLFSDFTMRLRFADDMNPHFAWYFMRSIMFQSQVEREKRGMGNMTNIFPGQVERMLIVACSRDRQDAIAAAVTAELQKRDDSLRSIEAKRKEIDALIESVIVAELNTITE